MTTFAPRVRAAIKATSPRFQPERFEIARVEDDGDGSSWRAYNDLGTHIVAGAPASYSSLKNLPPPFPPSSGRPATQPPAFDRQWVRNTILTLSDAAARQARFAALMGPPVAKLSGMEQYTRIRGNVTTVFLVDPSIGAATDIVEMKNGKLSHHTNISYSQPGDGTAVRTLLTIATYGARLHGGHTVSTVSFTNVHIGTQN